MNGQKTRHRIPPNRLFVLFGIVLFILFLLVQVIGSMINIPKTTAAMRVTVDYSFTAKGWFFRNEVLADGVSSETVKHIVRSGEKVQKDSALAIVYTDASALETSQKVEVLDDEITLLTSAMQSSANSGDAAKLDQQIAAQISTLSSKAQSGIVTGAESEAENLRNLCLRRSAGSLDGTALSAQISTLTTERDALERQIIGRSTTIASPASGFFSEIVDGFEEKLTIEALDNFTMKDFKALDPEKIHDAKNGQLGKIISDFRWNFVTAVPIETLGDCLLYTSDAADE